jgi:hypothetical protein
MHERREWKGAYVIGGHFHPFLKVGAHNFPGEVEQRCRIHGIELLFLLCRPRGLWRIIRSSTLRRRSSHSVLHDRNLGTLPPPPFLRSVVVNINRSQGYTHPRRVLDETGIVIRVVHLAEPFPDTRPLWSRRFWLGLWIGLVGGVGG